MRFEGGKGIGSNRCLQFHYLHWSLFEELWDGLWRKSAQLEVVHACKSLLVMEPVPNLIALDVGDVSQCTSSMPKVKVQHSARL